MANNINLILKAILTLCLIGLETKTFALATSPNSNSSSWGAGVAITFGSNGMAFGITGNASAGKGKANETTLTNQNTHINANDTITIKSNNDTNIKGAVVAANTVKADIGGNLSLESLQDTSTYKSSSQSMGGSVTVGYGASGSASYSQANAKSDYKSVNEQSAIKTKDGGFDIKVAGNTDLKGAVIESSDKAITDNKNSLTTATLTTSDIANKAQYSASSISVGISGGGSSMMGMGGYADDKGDASSTTKSAISKSNINITNEDKQKALTGKDAKDTVASISTDTKNSHTKLEKIFDKEEVEGKVQASAEITKTFSQNASQLAKQYVDSKVKASQDNAAKAQNSQDGKFEGKTAEQWSAEAKSWNGERQSVLNIAIAMIGGSPGSVLSSASKETLRLASIEMRDQMIADSEKFKGIKDANGNVLSNISGESVGVDGDGKKIAGGRIDLNNEKLQALLVEDKSTKSGYAEYPDGTIRLKDGIYVSDIPKFAPNSVSPLGGIQGSQGYIFGIPYSKGGIVDRVVESYAGPHDWLNSKQWYGSDGNIKSGMSPTDKVIGEGTNYGNVVVATPFAASRLIPSDVWEAIRVLTTVVK